MCGATGSERPLAYVRDPKGDDALPNSAPARLAEPDRQGHERVHPDALRESHARPWDREREIREAREEPSQGDTYLGTGERGAETEMDAVAERDVSIRVPAEVGSPGIVEDGGIAVRRGETREDHLTAADRPTQERDVLAGESRLRELRERHVPQELVNRGAGQAPI